MNTTVEKDATANESSDESKGHIFLKNRSPLGDPAGFLFLILEWSNVRDKQVEAIDEVAVNVVTKDIAFDEAEEKGDEVCHHSQEMTQRKSILYWTS